jgi:IPT/TIG domain/Galactose oxidase, central domain
MATTRVRNPRQRSEKSVKNVAALVLIAVMSGSWSYGCGYAGSTASPNGYNTAPTVSAISPNTAAAGGAAFTLTITGTNFVANSIVNFGGAAPATTFVSSTQLTAAIPSASIASSGTLSVSVTNSGPGGGTSNAVNFTVTSGTNPASNFTAVGNLTTARAEHTATLLPDGKVLIAGGFGNGFSQPLVSAELYDPSAGRFIPNGNMTVPRGRHTATLLANGKVLIAGGFKDTQLGTYIVSAEIYDPSTGTFTATGNMISGGGVRSTLLQDGRVFIAEDGNAAEIYDPATGTFALTGAYAGPSAVLVDTATLLPDGRVLVTGCAAACSTGTNQLFDPQTNTFSVTGPRRAWDTVSTATLLMNGTVLFVEGNDSALPDDAEVYDPTTGIFTHIGYTSEVHEFSAAVRLPDGTVLVAGGQLAGGKGNPSTELYVPATSMFASAGNMITGRHSHTATLLSDGTVLLAGGFGIWPAATSNTEIYKPSSGTH